MNVVTDKPPDSMNFEAQILLGQQIVLLAIFRCLDAKGVIPFSQAVQSLQEILSIFKDAPEKTKAVIELIIQSLQGFASSADPYDESKPPPAMSLHFKPILLCGGT